MEDIKRHANNRRLKNFGDMVSKDYDDSDKDIMVV